MRKNKAMKKKKAVKKKKALKRLDRVGELLSKLIDKFSMDDSGVRELLNSGHAFVARAKAKLKVAEPEPSRPAIKSSAKTKSAAAVKRTPPKAKRRPTRSKALRAGAGAPAATSSALN